MRMRLRAPDEPEAESSYDVESVDSSPEHSHILPPLDVGSPEYIEERLENLKRRPNWGDFLDQYVQNHPDSDSESEDGDAADVSVVDAPGFLRSTLWSLLVVAFAPLLVLCAPCLRHKGYGFWPLGCRSMKEFFGCALANVVFMVFGLVLLYWTICRELPDVFSVSTTLVKLNVQMDEVYRAADTCHASLLQWERTVAQELCMPVGIDGALLLLNAWLVLHCHRRWARYLMMLMAVMFVVDVPAKLYDATFPAPEIVRVDPTFAMVDEELQVALDGKNLKPGGSIAWVAYWGCATTSNVDSCEKQFPSTFEAGFVPVTFKSLDHFIPCYRDPPNPLKAQEYQCFENVRIRVKDKQSIPGWSRSVPQASLHSQPPLLHRDLDDDTLDNPETPITRTEDARVNRDAVETMRGKQRLATPTESIESVNIDISAAISTHDYTLENYKGSEVKNEVLELSGGESKQDNESNFEMEPAQPKKSEENDAVKGLRELEVTPEAEVKDSDIGSELDAAAQIQHVVLAKESLWQSKTETEGLHESSDANPDVEVVGTEIHSNADEIQAAHISIEESDLESHILLQRQNDEESSQMIDEVKATLVIVEDEGVIKSTTASKEGKTTDAEVKAHDSDGELRTMQASADEFRHMKLNLFVVEQEKKDAELRTSAPGEDLTTTSDVTQPAGVNTKKDFSMKRKSRRSHQAKTSSKQSFAETAEHAEAAV